MNIGGTTVFQNLEDNLHKGADLDLGWRSFALLTFSFMET